MNKINIKSFLEIEFSEILDSIMSDGYVIFKISAEKSSNLNNLKEEALKFFNLPKSIKNVEKYENQHCGYRDSGDEYSVTPERPDLNESLSYITSSLSSIKHTSPCKQFYEITHEYTFFLDEVVYQLLLELKKRYNSNERIPATRNGSWFQVNYYNPQKEDRFKLQDRHEDGHLITFWHSEQPGMQLFDYDQQVIPVALENNEILIMAGSLLYELTGGDIKPIYHQVVRDESLKERISYMYFVNPSPGLPLYSYNNDSCLDIIDIVSLGMDNPTSYGLPTVKE